MSANIFQEMLNERMTQIGSDVFAYEEANTKPYKKLFHSVEQYAWEKQFVNTALALPLVRGILSRIDMRNEEGFKDGEEYAIDFKNWLLVTRMLIDLHLPIEREEKDILLASTICCALPDHVPGRTINGEGSDLLTERYHLDPEITRIIRLISYDSELPEHDKKAVFRRIQENKLALLIMLADRGNLMGQLYGLSSWHARRYIYETRKYYFPMSIYANEHYTELLTSITVLTEKMRCLIEIAEILLSRYEAKETELTQEILTLKEENARLKGLIQRHKEE